MQSMRGRLEASPSAHEHVALVRDMALLTTDFRTAGRGGDLHHDVGGECAPVTRGTRFGV